MIENFEEFTPNVSKDDMEAIDLLRTFLINRVGKSKGITNSQLRILLRQQDHIVNGAKLRRYIQYIRANKMIPMLCAGKKGYYIAENEEQWLKYKEAFASRTRSMNYTLACMG